jgi:hypothetical protein
VREAPAGRIELYKTAPTEAHSIVLCGHISFEMAHRGLPKTHFAFGVDFWDDRGDSIVEYVALQSAGRFCAFFSGPEIPFPGNGEPSWKHAEFLEE